MKYLMGADIGTSALKMVVYNERLEEVRTVQREYSLHAFGERVEFPAEAYWTLFSEAYEEATAGLELTALAIDTQCETMILTDESGRPLRDAIVWLDNRAVKQADEIRARFGEQRVYEVSGQADITATWPACKLLWVRQEEPEIFAKIHRIYLLEDWLLYKLTGEFVTEMTLQSSTIYFDIRKEQWWQEMLDYVGIRPEQLPRLLKSGTPVGAYRGVTVVTGAIDQITASIGAGVTEKGIISEMTGTALVICLPSDTMPPYREGNKIPCHKSYDGKFCILPWSTIAGMALRWFRDSFCPGMSFRELDEMAEKVEPGCAGLTFLPYLCGIVIPQYKPDARGAFLGLTMEHGRPHAVRAILESVAYMLKQDLDALDVECEEIRAMGGGALSPLWCQIKADVVGKRIVTLKNSETSCLGSAILAGTAIGLFPSVAAAARSAVETAGVYEPSGCDYTESYRRFCEWEDKVL